LIMLVLVHYLLAGPRLIGLFVSTFCLVPAAAARDYSFKNIADSTGSFSEFGLFSVINNSGTVAFYATVGPIDDGNSGIFVGSGGPITTVVDNSGPFLSAINPSINDAGTVVFPGVLDAGGSGIFTRTGGGAIVTVVDSSGPFSGFGTLPSINNGGVVAFSATRDTGGEGIHTSSSGGAPTLIADTTGAFSSFHPGPSINAGGTVAFSANFDGGSGNGVFTGSGGPLSTIAEIGGGFASVYGTHSINAGGTVLFRSETSTGTESLYTSAGGILTPIVDTSGAFSDLRNGSINDLGVVVFGAELDAGGVGIFDGPDTIANKVIKSGDTLFGSTVTELVFARGLNDNGDIAFRYTLANGVSGIAVAQAVPEPASLSLLVVVGFAMQRRRRR
jgi:hypothetical protein